jgi:hypothetical protein
VSSRSMAEAAKADNGGDVCAAPGPRLAAAPLLLRNTPRMPPLGRSIQYTKILLSALSVHRVGHLAKRAWSRPTGCARRRGVEMIIVKHMGISTTRQLPPGASSESAALGVVHAGALPSM